jgi:hypothetical protein
MYVQRFRDYLATAERTGLADALGEGTARLGGLADEGEGTEYGRKAV